MSSIKNSDLLRMREMSNNQYDNLKQIAMRIFDKKLKSFLAFQSKQQVLQNCQQLLVAKTIQYTNIITQLQKGQLKALNSLNEILLQKDNNINKLNQSLNELQSSNKEQQIMIGFKNQDIQLFKKEIRQIKQKLSHQQQTNIQVTQQNEKSSEMLKNDYYILKSKFEKQNRQLQRDLIEKTEDLRITTINYKNEINTLRTNKDKQILQINKKNRQGISDLHKMRIQLEKDKRYLQDLVEVKQDEIKQLNKIKHKQVKRKVLQCSDTIQLTIYPDIQVTPAKTKIIYKPKKVDKKIQINQIGIQVSIDCNIDCHIVQDPIQNSQNIVELKLREFIDMQYKKLYNKKVQQLNIKLSSQLKEAMQQSKKLIFDLLFITHQQIKHTEFKLLQIQQLYEQRPSRQQDLEYMTDLASQNTQLINLCNEASNKTDQAYVALNLYHNQLQSYKKVVPIRINGRTLINQQTKINITQMSRTQPFRKFYSNKLSQDFYIKTPKRAKRHSMCQQKFFQNFKNETETDISPLKNKYRKLRPQTGISHSLRKHSGHF